jgi:transposase-like protein
MSTRDIEAHLRELYGVSVGRDLISRVTDAVMDDVRDWTLPVASMRCSWSRVPG